ncbi:DUF4253 domain-containing protein [Streptomyces sp. NBC_01210]|uniref:DUF4253 domain-containing protein n=1 Tax=Streptomyces sp. NBC_01210 TaxID=2903774 RepID=UPI002E11F527|nr:DUF4253 domain-containing protein [Streptomyces sp. NBC_01210]
MVINPSALGLDLPSGAMRVQPSLWYANDPAQHDTWARLLPAREACGMHPVLLVNEESRSLTWDKDLDVEHVSHPDDHDLEEVLISLWSSVQAEDADQGDADTIAPFTPEWPGLAPAGEPPAQADATAARVAAELLDAGRLKAARAGLIRVRRSADIPVALGRLGPCNHADTGLLSTVLRSWEDRFGIRVVALHFDRLDVSVAAPPRSMMEALAVAAEHHAFCPDNVRQGYDTIREYAERALLGKQHWTFRWD